MDIIERSAKDEEKKKKASSLVERAASLDGKSPFASKKQSGDAKTEKRDPSSMNPGDQESQSRPFAGGIGDSSARKNREAKPKDENADADLPQKDDPTTLAIGKSHIDSGGADKTPVEIKKAKKKPEQEVDLVSLREAGYITPDMPPNLMSEEFRIIKRSILLNAFSKGMQKSKNSNVILVTSSNPAEGKTFCTINLALSIATEQDTTVLLVDADFSKPEVLNRLGVAGGRGLMDVVADGELDVSDCLIRTNIPNLVLLPAGRQHNLTTELLASERMEAIVDEIATRYPDRLVIFDSPPVLASSAASVLALYMGQVVFVIKAEETSEPQIKESLNMISACENINLLLNQTKFSGSNKRFATYYGYGGR
ncbi:XrtA-associated tyrosine autokinase [Kordiimonas pumila]|uniref:non-specific protein-tyrosine kinase n=1 Tax=Kordiimonas pumila TaxID=2161677 RepID=A0ABV7D2X2_9PROT|nr:XrtA-associated tyrosine autokinase [Kordiimonas pumila]